MLDKQENIQWKKDKINLIVLSLIHKVEIDDWKVRYRKEFHKNKEEIPKSLQNNTKKLGELHQELKNYK